jgi:hypothetical protein
VHREKRRDAHTRRILVGRPKERKSLEVLGVYGRIILKCILNE